MVKYSHGGDAVVWNGGTYHWNTTMRPPELDAAIADGSVTFHGPQARAAAEAALRVAVRTDIANHRQHLDKLMHMIMVSVTHD